MHRSDFYRTLVHVLVINSKPVPVPREVGHSKDMHGLACMVLHLQLSTYVMHCVPALRAASRWYLGAVIIGATNMDQVSQAGCRELIYYINGMHLGILLIQRHFFMCKNI